MIEPSSGSSAALNTIRETSARKVFRMTQSDRMAGSVPVWETPRGEPQYIEQTLTRALNGNDGQSAGLNNALAYQTLRGHEAGADPEEFGFGDLLDMVNPLQQIPVIGHVYREITGDTIKPISQIVGGAIFSGPLGAAVGLTNAIVREETGKDIAGNALALAQGDAPEWKNGASPPDQTETTGKALAMNDPLPVIDVAPVAATPVQEDASPSENTLEESASRENPEARLTHAAQMTEREAYQALPPSVMGFADVRAAASAAPARAREDSPESNARTRYAWQDNRRYND